MDSEHIQVFAGRSLALMRKRLNHHTHLINLLVNGVV